MAHVVPCLLSSEESDAVVSFVDSSPFLRKFSEGLLYKCPVAVTTSLVSVPEVSLSCCSILYDIPIVAQEESTDAYFWNLGNVYK